MGFQNWSVNSFVQKTGFALGFSFVETAVLVQYYDRLSLLNLSVLSFLGSPQQPYCEQSSAHACMRSCCSLYPCLHPSETPLFLLPPSPFTISFPV